MSHIYVNAKVSTDFVPPGYSRFTKFIVGNPETNLRVNENGDISTTGKIATTHQATSENEVPTLSQVQTLISAIPASLHANDPLVWTPSTSTLSINAASGTNAGYITTGTQTIAGSKTFSLPVTGASATDGSHLLTRDQAYNRVASIQGSSPLSFDGTSLTMSISNASASTSGIITTGTQTIAGSKTFTSPVVGVAATLPTQYVTKNQLDETVSTGVSWKSPVDTFVTTEPLSPTLGERIIFTATAGDFTKDYIYECTDTTPVTWEETIPDEGNTLWVVSDTSPVFANQAINWNGTAWVAIGSSIRHQDLVGAGTNTHSQIDTHISTTTTDPHAGQDLRTTAGPTFNTLTVTNDIYAENFTVRAAPCGFPNHTDSILSYNPTTRVVSLTPSSTSFSVWVMGKKYTKTTVENATAHDPTPGIYYYYYNHHGVLTGPETSYGDYSLMAPIALVYYRDTSIYDLYEERHSPLLDPVTHNVLNAQLGAYYESGLGIADYTTPVGSPSGDSDNAFSIASGEYRDEDLIQSVAGVASGGGANGYCVTWRDTAYGLFNWSSTTLPFVSAVGGYVYYNNYTGGAWTLTEGATGKFINYWIVFMSSVYSFTQTRLLVGQTLHDDLTSAQAETFAVLQLGSIPLNDLYARYRVTYQLDSGYTTTGKAKIAQVELITSSLVTITGGTSISSHNGMSGIQLAGSGVTYGHVTDGTQTFYGSKSFNSTLSTPAITASGAISTTDTTASTTTTTGSGRFAGGVGVAGAIYNGGVINSTGVISTSNTTASTTPSTGSGIFGGGVGVAGQVTAGGSLKTTSTTASTDTATGSGVFGGGIGVAGAIYNGGVINSVGVISTSNTTPSTTTGTGSGVFGGGIGVAGAIYNGGVINSAGVISTSNTTASTTTTTGSGTFGGGVGVAGQVTCGGALKTTDTTASTTTTTGSGLFGGGIGVVGQVTAGGALKTTSTTASTTTATGSGIFGGGIGVAGAIYNGGVINSSGVISTSDSTASTTTTTGSGVFGGGAGVAGQVTAGGALKTTSTTASTTTTTGSGIFGGGVGVAGQVTAGGALKTTDTTASTTTTTGSGIFAGGVGVAGQVTAGGALKTTDTTASTSTITGSGIFAGGVGIAGTEYIGGDSNIAGTIIGPGFLESYPACLFDGTFTSFLGTTNFGAFGTRVRTSRIRLYPTSVDINLTQTGAAGDTYGVIITTGTTVVCRTALSTNTTSAGIKTLSFSGTDSLAANLASSTGYYLWICCKTSGAGFARRQGGSTAFASNLTASTGTTWATFNPTSQTVAATTSVPWVSVY
jgi:hypothetical protein